MKPTSRPSCQPLDQPTRQPSSQPSSHPTSKSLGEPSSQPPLVPSCQPSSQPSCQPSFKPTEEPSSQPSPQPSCQPYLNPSSRPSSLPILQQRSTQPSLRPIVHLSISPTVSPLILSEKPSRIPSLAPSVSPTAATTFFAVISQDVNSSLAVNALASLSNSSAEVAIVNDDVRVVSQLFNSVLPGTSIAVVLPITEQEAILEIAGNLAIPSITLFSSATSNNGNGSVYVAVAVLSSSLWIPPPRPVNSSSPPIPPLAEKVGQLQSDLVAVVTVGDGIDVVDIGFPAGAIAQNNATRDINFTIYCPPRVVHQKLFLCNDTGYVESVQCNGLASVVRGTCPKLQQVCASLDLATMTVAVDNMCQTLRNNRSSGGINSTNDGLLCRCGLGSGLNVPGSSIVTAGIVLGLGSSDLSKTFQASSAFGDGSAASKAAIVLSVFVSVWVIALIAALYFYSSNWKLTAKQTDAGRKFIHYQENEKNERDGLLPFSGMDLKAQTLANLGGMYLCALFPAAFLPSSLLEGLCGEVYRKHMYINFFFRLHRSRNPIVDIVKIVTLQSFLLFLLALLYDLNFPSDDGSCSLYTSKSACLQRKLLFDASQSYCRWAAFPYSDLLATDDDEVYFECLYGESVVSLTAATYTSMILSLATCLAMDPLDYVLSLLAAPTVVSLNQSENSRDKQQQQGTTGSNTLERNNDSLPDKGASSSKFSRFLPSQVVPLVTARSTDIERQESNVIFGYNNAALCTFPQSSTMLDLETAIQRQRMLLLQNDMTSVKHGDVLLVEFDKAWGLDSSTGLFTESKVDDDMVAIVRMTLGNNSSRRQRNVRKVVQHTVLKVQQEASVVFQEVKDRTQAEIGFEIMVHFVQDLLGRSTAAARIFSIKMEMDYATMQRVSIYVKASIILLLVCLNVLFFCFTLLRGISRGLAWQRSYILTWLLQTVLDICVFETMQVAWFHYFIPSLVKKDVCEAKSAFEGVLARAIGHIDGQFSPCFDGTEEQSELNAPDFLFVSCQVARKFPLLAESFIVQQYHSPLPAKAGLPWLELARVGNEQSKCLDSKERPAVDLSLVTRQHGLIGSLQSGTYSAVCFVKQIYLRACYIAKSAFMHLVIILPLEIQSLVIRIIEPVVLSCVLFFFLLVSSRPVFLALTIILLIALAASIIWEHFSTIRARRKIVNSDARSGPQGDGASHHVVDPQQHFEQQQKQPMAIHSDDFQALEVAGEHHAELALLSSDAVKVDESRSPSPLQLTHGLRAAPCDEEKSDNASVSPVSSHRDDASDSSEDSLRIRQLFSDWSSSDDEGNVAEYESEC